ncbi:MAG TPA: hypothetical protein VIU64_13285, partial [Polyangia bacterium]
MALALSISLSLVGGGTSPAHAEPARTRLDAMSREIRQLRAEVQALRSILAEIAELDRQRSALLAKALGVDPGNGAGRREAARAAAAPAPSPSGPLPPSELDAPTGSPNPSAPSLEGAPGSPPAAGTVSRIDAEGLGEEGRSLA